MRVPEVRTECARQCRLRNVSRATELGLTVHIHTIYTIIIVNTRLKRTRLETCWKKA
jgi:hypothetical protein